MSAHAAAGVPDQHYVAATKPLQAGQIIKVDDLELIAWPAAHPIAGTFGRIDEVAGRSVLYPLDKGQPITERLLATTGSGAGLSSSIPEGMRAIALRSDEVMGVAGFIFPGSHVDVLVTYRMEKSPESVTLTVLQNAEVLAAGQKNQPDPEGKPVTATVVTLLLTPEGAQRAVLASTQGAIHFVLRNGADKAFVPEFPLALSELSSAHKTADVATPSRVIAHPAKPQPPIVVETIAGDKQSTDTFGKKQ